MIVASAIEGVTWSRLTVHADSRGAFREIWRRSSYRDLEREITGTDGAAFVQANRSTSAAGVLRGMHFHLRQLDHWVLLSGRAFVALADVRPLLAGGDLAPEIETRTLEADETVSIPRGVAHGFLALGPIELLYLVTNEYDGSDELGFAWDDPLAAIPWPRVGTADRTPILSDRDRGNPSLREIIARIR